MHDKYTHIHSHVYINYIHTYTHVYINKCMCVVWRVVVWCSVVGCGVAWCDVGVFWMLPARSTQSVVRAGDFVHAARAKRRWWRVLRTCIAWCSVTALVRGGCDQDA